jgi:Plexin cytoplasmic RasGAP domain.
MNANLISGFPTQNGGVLMLKDEDGSNILEGEWKKLNTLEHYKVNTLSSSFVLLFLSFY